MGRSPCCSKEGLNRGAWTAMEDKILREYIKVHGEGKWRNLPKRAGLKRCGKSCRLRWLNYLRPDIKRGNITHDEEELIIRLHNLLGNRWSLIAGRLPGRTDNEIKNYWNTNIGKKIQSSHDPAATSHSTSCLAKAKPPSSANQLPPPSPNKTTHFSTTAQEPYSRRSTISSPKSSVVRTKATKCTKVLLQLPQDIPQKKSPPFGNHDHHDNSTKPPVDYAVVPPVNTEVENVDDFYDQMMAAGAGHHDQHDHEPLVDVPFDVPAYDFHESNSSSQFMALPDHDHHVDFDPEKFLADFPSIDCLDLDLSDCFDGNFNNMIMNAASPSCKSTTTNNNKGFDETGLLFSQDVGALYGVNLQSGTANNDSDLIDASDEMDVVQG